MNATFPVEGGCFCGRVRYQIDQIKLSLNCHCTMCRRTSGAPFVSWLLVPNDQFRYLTGKPKHLQSSEHGERWFCDNCGTPISCVVHGDKEDKYIDITLGSLDRPNEFPPKKDYYLDSKLNWL